jgi:hypothetical protein
MHSLSLRSVSSAICLIVTLTMNLSFADAVDLRLAAGLASQGSEWRGDVTGVGQLKLGVRFMKYVGICAEVRVGYGAVDQRMLTGLTLGVQGWLPMGGVFPYARLAFIHQHEESFSVVAGDVGKALFGIGDGIRHRAGGLAAVGVDIPLVRNNRLQWFASVEAVASYFPGDMGPQGYWGGGVGIGFSYSI